MNRTFWLIAGDIIVFLLFAYIGRSAHGHEITPLGVIGTASPFFLAWLAIGAVTGAFRPAAYGSVGQAAKKTLLTWIIAGPVALVARAWYLGSGFFWTFAAITIVTNAVFLLIWRIAFALAAGRTRTSS